MPRKGHRHISAEQSRANLIDMMQYLRDYAISRAKETLDAGDWRTALTCLNKAAMYDEKASAAERGEQIPPGY